MPLDLATETIASISASGGQLANSSRIKSISKGNFFFSLLLASFTKSLYSNPTIIVTRVKYVLSSSGTITYKATHFLTKYCCNRLICIITST